MSPVRTGVAGGAAGLPPMAAPVGKIGFTGGNPTVTGSTSMPNVPTINPLPFPAPRKPM